MFLGEVPAVAVKSAAGIATAAGMWTIVLLLTGSMITSYIKQLAPIKKIFADRHTTDMDRLSARVTELEALVREANGNASAAKDKAHAAETSQSIIIAVVQLLMTEVEKLDPGNSTLVQCREMIGAAMQGDFGMSFAIKRLAAMPAVGANGAAK